ncbi:MAG: cation:proton antiporter [Bdellovibrionales bacterium]|nr:cation:proton antiporter [Bdellovibrionales bacterium]
MAIVIIGIAILFFLGHGLSWFFEKTKIPDLLILVALGYFLGPVFGIINAEDLGKVGGVVATTALIVILYEGGLHLSARDLLTSSLPAFGLTIVGFGLIVTCGALVGWGIALKPLPISMLLGVGIGSTSSAIVIPMVKQLSISDNTKTILGLESAFTDVLTIVIFLVLVDSFASGQFSAQELIVGIGPKTVIAGLMGIFSGFVWAYIKRKYSRLVSMAFAGEAWALLTYGLIEAMKHNGAIGVLTLGFMLANLDLLPTWLKNQVSNVAVSYKDMSLLSEITYILRTFFFLYLGLLIQFSNWKIVIIALIISILVFVTRYIAIWLLYSPQKYSRLDAMVSTAMGPRGLACAVLATIPLQRGIEEGQWLQNVLFAVIPITITFTAIFVALSENASFRNKMEKLFHKYPNAALQPTVPNVEK